MLCNFKLLLFSSSNKSFICYGYKGIKIIEESKHWNAISY